MTLVSRAFAAMAKLPAAPKGPTGSRRVAVHRGLSVRARDGVILRTDVYAPADGDAPVLLVRTPYGRGGPTALIARNVAERGYRVVVQSCRGTADSGGTFEPMRNERDDGLDCVDWLKRQPWYRGAFAMFGPSYVGFTQWAVAADVGPDLKALCTTVTASSFRDPTYAGGGFSLDTVLTWSSILAAQRGPATAALADLLRGQPKLRRGLTHPVLAEADAVAVGAAVPHFQEWLRETAADAPYWLERGHAHRVSEVTTPVLMIGGWYDIFLPWQLVDHATLRAAGRRPRLVIGPWHHGSAGLVLASVREALPFLDEHLRGGPPADSAPVRVFVGGTRQWRALDDWPPPHGVQEWFLRSDGGLAPERGPDAGRRRFRYDPADPTPSVGGPRLMGSAAGIRDNRRLEARGDVLVYTSAPLTAPVEAVGPVRAVVRTTSSTPSFDVFVRVCDVRPDGRSENICDGLLRVPSAVPGEVHEVPVDLWPMAHVFGAGHRIRVQVSGGAHPRWSRNPGTGAALFEPGPMTASDRDVLDGSMLILPVPG